MKTPAKPQFPVVFCHCFSRNAKSCAKYCAKNWLFLTITLTFILVSTCISVGFYDVLSDSESNPPVLVVGFISAVLGISATGLLTLSCLGFCLIVINVVEVIKAEYDQSKEELGGYRELENN